MAETMRLFQLASVGVFVATLIVGLWGWRRYPTYRAAFLPPMMAAAFGAVFYVLWLTETFPANELLVWGAVQRFVTAVVIFGGVMALTWALGGRNGK